MNDELRPRGLLNARNRAGRTVAEVVAAHFAVHGARVVEELAGDPAAYLRLASELAALKGLLRAHASPDTPAPASGAPPPQEQLAGRLLEAVNAHFAQHGPQILTVLGEANPGAYARFVSEVVQFKMLTAERAPRKNPGRPPRPSRKIQMKKLLEAMDEAPIDPNNLLLPRKHRDRWIEAELALLPRRPMDLKPEELRQAWGEDLARWWESQCRPRFRAARRRDRRRRLRLMEMVWELPSSRKVRVRLWMRREVPQLEGAAAGRPPRSRCSSSARG